MKKLVSVMVIAMMLALAFTVAANAEVWTPQTDGLYDFTFTSNEVQADAMYGMVVIEAATEPAEFELTQDNIRYIDQVTANGSTLSFTDVGPMDLQDNGTYYVYIGGEGYTKATKIGTLSETGATPEPPATQTFTVTFVADGVTVREITKNVGETVLTTEFPEVPAKTGFTGKWNVTTDITETATVTAVYEENVVTPVVPTAVTLSQTTATLEIDGTVTLTETVTPAEAEYTAEWTSSAPAIAEVVNGVVTAKTAGTAIITVKVAENVTDTCEITVNAAQTPGEDDKEPVLGDINGDTTVDIKDATLLFNYSMFPEFYPISYTGNVDYVLDGSVDIKDATYLFNYSMFPEFYPIG